MIDWASVLRHIAPHARDTVVDALAPHLEDAIGAWDAVSQANFLGQCAHETAGFATLVEYGDAKYFRRYDGRKDLGNVYPGDGYKFRGRGPFQLTGRANYARYGMAKSPDEVGSGAIGLNIAIKMWNAWGCPALAEADNALAITRKINGGTNGLASRRAYIARAKHILGTAASDTPAPPSVEKIKAIQKRLDDLGYHMVGQADGEIGSSTTAAIAAFQHDQDMPVSGHLDEATEDALWATDDQRPITDERANGAPESTAFTGAQRLFAGAGVMTTGFGATQINGALDQAETVKSYADRVQALAEPFHWMTGHPGLLACAGSAAVLAMAWQLRGSLLADFRSGKTS